MYERKSSKEVYKMISYLKMQTGSCHRNEETMRFLCASSCGNVVYILAANYFFHYVVQELIISS